MASTVHFCQINLQKSINASVQLNKRSEEVSLVTEPLAYKGRILHLGRQGTSVLSGGPHARAAVMVNNALDAWLVPAFSDNDLCTIAFKVSGRLTYVCSLYLDINLTVEKHLFLELVD